MEKIFYTEQLYAVYKVWQYQTLNAYEIIMQNAIFLDISSLDIIMYNIN